MKSLSIFTAVLLAGSSAFAAANTNAAASGGDPHPCKQDAQTFCANVEKGQGRMGQCMKAHESQVSPACKAKMVEREQRHAEHKAAEGKTGDAGKAGMAGTNVTAH